MIERVVVTGAAGSLGAACVGAFQRVGAEVIGVDIRPSSSADIHIEMDISEPDCGTQLVEHLGDRAIDVLVNNAALGHVTAAAETSTEQFDDIIAVNLRAPFSYRPPCCRPFDRGLV